MPVIQRLPYQEAWRAFMATERHPGEMSPDSFCAQVDLRKSCDRSVSALNSFPLMAFRNFHRFVHMHPMPVLARDTC